MQTSYYFGETEYRHLLAAMHRYWPRAQGLLQALPVDLPCTFSGWRLPPELVSISLPDWAKDIGVESQLLVPQETVRHGGEPEWRRTNWFAAAFWYLTGLAERAHEQQHGPIHSYSYRLKNWNGQQWDHAWVNRIALFLRRWAARERNTPENELFGPLPRATVLLTHDLDAINKTLAGRAKQSAFSLLNCVRSLRKHDWTSALAKAAEGWDHLTAATDYWCFDEVTSLEKHHGMQSSFNIYGGESGALRMPLQFLIDPNYDVMNPRLRKQLRRLRELGWAIGLHPSYLTWNNAALLQAEHARVEQAIGADVSTCRQHWLRFSWQSTWRLQQESGLKLDCTLGFNDRPGFRNGCAGLVHPWDPLSGCSLELKILPTLFMDSHFYDYKSLTDEERRQEIAFWLEEIRAVGGEIAILWHVRVMSKDFGWGEGYKDVLSYLRKREFEALQPNAVFWQ